MDIIKFSVKNGQTEISYEGSIHNLESHFWPTLDRILGLDIWQSAEPKSSEPSSETMSGEPRQRKIPQMTINNICAKLDVDSGPDLVVAACVYLTYVKGMNQMPRKEILQTMKDASRFYKDTYGSNLSSYLSSLTNRGSLMERSEGIYILTSQFAAEMEAKLV
jgi:hypothetical protein